jgi:hypothetical protein
MERTTSLEKQTMSFFWGIHPSNTKKKKSQNSNAIQTKQKISKNIYLLKALDILAS